MGAAAFRRNFARDYVQARPGDRVLDIGCGPARLRAFLPEVDYIGWEPNAAYIAQAERDFAGCGEFHVGLFGAEQARATEPVDVAVIGAVLHHLDDAQMGALLADVRTVLKPGGRVVTVDPVYIARQNPLARLMINLDRGRHVRTVEHYTSLARQSFAQVGGTVVAQAFPPYTYFYMVLSP